MSVAIDCKSRLSTDRDRCPYLVSPERHFARGLDRAYTYQALISPV